MYQAHPPSNGAAMTHQQTQYNTVPPSPQQQPGGQPNHNQQSVAVPPRHAQYQTYATQTAQPRAQQPIGGSHPNQQATRILQYPQHPGTTQPGHTQPYIPQSAQGQQGYHSMQHVPQMHPRQPASPATAYYAVPPGTQPIMTIHSPHLMFQQNGPRQQVSAQQYFPAGQQMVQGQHQAIQQQQLAAAQTPHQVLYNYPPTLYGHVPAFQHHITGPPPMMAAPGQPQQIQGVHPAQPPPQVSQPGQQGQVQTQSNAGGGQPTIAPQHQMQQATTTHQPAAQQQGQQNTGHPTQGVSRPQPTPTPPILIPPGTSANPAGHSAAPSSVPTGHPAIINHPIGPPPPQVLPVQGQSGTQHGTNMYGPGHPHKHENQHKRPRKGIAIIDPETRKEVVVNKSGANSTATETTAQKEATSSKDQDTVDTEIATKESNDGEVAAIDERKQKSEQIRAEFQSKVIEATKMETESDTGTRKKSQDPAINNTVQGDVSDQVKITTQSMANKVPDSEIHSETLQQKSLQCDSAPTSTESLEAGNLVSLNADDVSGSKSAVNTVSDGAPVTNDNINIANKPNILAKKATDITKEEKAEDSESEPSGQEKSAANNGSNSNTMQLNDNKTGPSSLLKEDPLTADSVPARSTPSRNKEENSDYEPISPTPLTQSVSFSSAIKASSSTSATKSKATNVESQSLAESDVSQDKSASQPCTATLPSATAATLGLRENQEDHVNKAMQKHLTGKAKRDEINRKEPGSDMDVFTDRNLNSKDSSPSSVIKQSFLKQSTGDSTTHNDNLKTEDAETPSFESQNTKPEEIMVSNQSNKVALEINPNHGNTQTSMTENTEVHEHTQISLGPEYDTNEKHTQNPLSESDSQAGPVQELNSTGQNRNDPEPDDIPPNLFVIAGSDEVETYILENGVSDKVPVLKYEYKPDQWSPINIDGKKQYDREFLIKLQQDPLSMTKPENLPNMDIIKDRAIAKISSAIPGASKMPDGMFTPSFVKSTPSGNRGPPPGRASNRKKDPRLGPPSQGQNQMVIKLPSTSIPVELHTDPNAWKPTKLKANDENEDDLDEMAVLERKARAILNKLTPQNFDTLVHQFKSSDIDTMEKLTKAMELIFEKALDEPAFSVTYAKMCEVLKDKGPSHSEEDPKKAVNFKRILIATCQKEFYRDYTEGLGKSVYETDMAEAQSDEKRMKEIQAEWDAKERRARKRSLGNIRFIGELYKLKMLTLRIMHECVNKLLSPMHNETIEAREESLECLCKLLTTVGKDLDEETTKRVNDANKGPQSKPQDGIKKLDVYFAEIQNVIDAKQMSARIRFRLQDLIDLRRRRWVPRRDEAGPKKIDAIHADIAREKTLQQLHDHNVGNVGMRLGSREGSKAMGADRDGRGNVGGQDGRKRSARGPQGPGGMPTDHEGWNTVPIRPPSKAPEKFDPSKLPSSNIFNKKDDNISLGMRPMGQGFGQWGKGSGGGRMSQPKEDPRESSMQSNRFASLYNQPVERSVSPSGQPFGGRPIDRQGSSGSQSPSSTFDRQHRAAAGGSRSMGPPNMAGPRDYRETSRGPHDNNEQQSAIQAVARFTKMPSNGPHAGITRKPSDSLANLPPSGPSEEDIRKNQHTMEGKKVKEHGRESNELDRCVNNFLDEYLHSCDEKEVESTIKESFNADVMPKCVELWVERVIDRTPKNRLTLANLLCTLVNKSLLQRAQCLTGLGKWLQAAIDLICDIPKIWEYLGQIVAPMLESKVFPMKFLLDTAMEIDPDHKQCEEAGQYAEAVLRILSQTVGTVRAGNMWKEANLNWSMFLPSGNIDTFIAKHKLEFTQNDASSNNVLPSEKSSEQIQDNLTRLLKISPPNQNHAITEYINSYLTETTGRHDGAPDNRFIRILTTAVAESTIKGIGIDQPNNISLNLEALQHRANILKRILDAKVERETQALYALQALIHKLEHPNKLLHQIFECLYQSDVITYEGFEQWETSKDPSEQEGKGVAVKSTTQFFTWLREVEPDDEQ